MRNLLIKNVSYVTPDFGVKKGNIAISGATITHVGEGIPAHWQPTTTIEGEDLLASPGLVNSHTHAAMSLFRSYADDMPLMDWLQNKIWPAEAKLRSDDIYWGTLFAIAEMIRTGTTTFADMYFFMDQVAHAVEESGIRAVLSRGLVGVTPNGAQSLTEGADFFRTYHGAADGRITVMLGPHAPYTCPAAYLHQVIDKAAEIGAELHIHLSETAGEVEECYKRHGKSPIALMEVLGLFSRGVLAAHCVHLSADDIDILARNKVRIAHNPGSNMKLASGIAPIPALLQAGVCVGLGTDGAASNNNLDMLEEARLTALLHKAATLDPQAIPAAQALRLATVGGAHALGLAASVGGLTPGYQADLVLYSLRGLEWHPRQDLISQLIYAASSSSVDTVIVAGKILFEQGKTFTTLDIERIKYEVNQRSHFLTT